MSEISKYFNSQDDKDLLNMFLKTCTYMIDRNVMSFSECYKKINQTMDDYVIASLKVGNNNKEDIKSILYESMSIADYCTLFPLLSDVNSYMSMHNINSFNDFTSRMDEARDKYFFTSMNEEKKNEDVRDFESKDDQINCFSKIVSFMIKCNINSFSECYKKINQDIDKYVLAKFKVKNNNEESYKTLLYQSMPLAEYDALLPLLSDIYSYMIMHNINSFKDFISQMNEIKEKYFMNIMKTNDKSKGDLEQMMVIIDNDKSYIVNDPFNEENTPKSFK